MDDRKAAAARGGASPRPLSYGTYLKVPELLALQVPLSSPPEHDEMLFIIIHQVYELWFKQMLHEAAALRSACFAGKSLKAPRHLRRLIEIQRVLLQQIAVLETMTPADFLRFRDHLNPASGFQSRQFRELEFLSGMKDPAMLPYLDLTADERRSFEARLAEPSLRDAFDALLGESGFPLPAAAAGEGSRRAARVDALRRIYESPDEHDDLYKLCEAMIEYDENFMLWRYHHVLMVERMIGHKRGTGGTEGVSYLITTLSKRCFPELWEVRTQLGGGSGSGYGAPPPAERVGALKPHLDASGLPRFPERFNLARYLLDDRIDEGRGQAPAVHASGRTWSYAEVASLANRAGNALAELGAGAEDRVLLILPDGIEFVAAWFGALKIGAAFAMANTIHPPDDYAYYLEYTRAPVAVVAEEVLPRLESVLPGARHLERLLVVEDEAGSGRISKHPTFRRLIDSSSDRLETFDSHRDDVAGWLFTSGTTGHPKAAVHSHQDFAFNTETYAKQVVGYGERDVTLSVPKLFFGYATGTNLIFPFAFGGSTALFPDRSTPERIFEMIERHHPTVLTSVPTMINAMLQHPGAAGRDLSSLRVCLSAGEALPPELYRRWKEAFGVEILDGIGSAEMFHIYSSNRFGEVTPGSLGRPVPGYQVRIVGPDGADVPPGREGTLWVRGGSAASGYWQERERSRETFRGEWCVTGDQFRRDERGLLWYEGRTDDMLKVSGIFVSPLEIEDCLYHHPAVKDVCVVGGADREGLTRPRAYVTVKEGASPCEALARELKDLAKRTLSPYKYPRWVCFVEDLPRSDRGKVQRKAIRDGYPLKAVHPEIDLGGKE